MSKDKQKMAFLIVVGIVAGALISWQGIWKTSTEITKLKVEIDKKKGEIKSYEDKINQIPKLLEERSKIEEVVEEFSRILPDSAIREEQRLNKLIEEFVGEKANIELVKFGPKDRGRAPAGKQEEEPSAFERHRYEMEILGHFFDFVTFVNQIEKSEKFIKVDSFKCTRVREEKKRPGGDLTYLTCRVTFSFYTYKPTGAPGAGGPPKRNK